MKDDNEFELRDLIASPFLIVAFILFIMAVKIGGSFTNEFLFKSFKKNE